MLTFLLVFFFSDAFATPAGLPPRRDADRDTYSRADGDCNDRDATIHPGAVETDFGLDDIDNDCDGEIDEGYELFVWLTAEFEGDTSSYTLSTQVFNSTDVIGDWWDEELTSTFVREDSEVMWNAYITDDWYLDDSCGVRIQFTETHDSSDDSWYCQTTPAHGGYFDDETFEIYVGTDAMYTEDDFEIWYAPGSGCSAILIWDEVACPL